MIVIATTNSITMLSLDIHNSSDSRLFSKQQFKHTVGTNIVKKRVLSSLEKTASVNLDSVMNNSITKIYVSNDILYVDVTIKDQNSKIRLSVYNMLAKEVLLISDNVQSSENITYQKNISDLPNGAYICVLVGSSFRNAKKFIISR